MAFLYRKPGFCPSLDNSTPSSDDTADSPSPQHWCIIIWFRKINTKQRQITTNPDSQLKGDTN